MPPTIIHEDHHGSIIDDSDNNYLEIRWYDASSEFTGDTFNRRQEIIAGVVEQCGRSGTLIDAVQFGMNGQDMDIDWRDANTIPRFNAAGVRKQALIFPAGFLPIGAPPTPEGPAQFPTAYFAKRAETQVWLAS